MDQDAEISTSLDILADFCTQNSDDYDGPWTIRYRDDNMGEIEVTTLETTLETWLDKNDFKTRIWDIFRNTLKYGDQFFVRDPETFEWHWCDPMNVEKIIVNESMGKEPTAYFIKDLSLNLHDKVISNQQQSTNTIAYPGAMPNSLSGGGGSQYGSAGSSGSGGGSGSPFPGQAEQNVLPVDAKHVIHLSMSTGMDAFWPFGTSILENIFKTYKQKELLEDSIIIYRVQRAPERRVFKIDVGDLPEHKAMQYVERMKNEIHQRRIPSNKGGSTSLVDAAYNPLCLDMETRIPLLDGRTLSIRELQAEYEMGKENWAFSCNPETGDVVPGNITWAGVTQKSAKVIKITLDNGETLTVTPEHKIPVLGYGFKEAKDLTENDSLIAFNTEYESLDSDSTSGRTYQKVYNHETRKYEFTHRMVGTYFREIGKHQEFTYLEENVNAHKNTIHHKDYNRYNNDPRNLQWMNHEDHFKFHSDHRSEMWENMTDEEFERVTTQISNTLKERFESLDADGKKEVQDNMREVQKKSVASRKTPEGAAKYKESMSPVKKQRYIDHPDELERFLAGSKEQQDAPWCNIKKVYTREMLNRIVKLVKDNDANKALAITLCDNDQFLLDLFAVANPLPEKGIDNIDRSKWGYSKLEGIIKHFKYKGWREFKQNIANYNHKIVNIEYLDDEIEVGTITIDGNEKWHNFHTFAIESGIFVKNSILEDFFFPQTADGRGSDVTVLPGGDNLGCFSLDTKIRLLDGRDLSILEIEAEMLLGIELWTYSCHPVTGFVTAGLISWAGKTRTDADVMQITLDNNETIICTPDHKYPIKGIGFVEARDLTEGQYLISSEAKSHYIINIEYLDEKMDVGTLSIDSEEKYHDYHTFSLSCGVFVKNSINDLVWFNNKLIRGLKIPSSYLPFGPEDGGHVSNDGGQGALIQEHRFNKYCQRLQSTLVRMFDDEFKAYLEHNGYNVSPSSFQLMFRPPMNFAAYRRAELEGTMIQTYAAMNDMPFIAKQTILNKMGWTQADIVANEKSWLQENPTKVSQAGASMPTPTAPGLNAVGVDNPQDFDMGGDEFGEDGGFDDMGDIGESPISGAEQGSDDTF